MFLLYMKQLDAVSQHQTFLRIGGGEGGGDMQHFRNENDLIFDDLIRTL